MTKEQIKAKAKEQFPNDDFKQQIVIDAINWATKELQAQLAISEHDREHNDYELAEAYKKIAELKSRDCWKGCLYASGKSELIHEFLQQKYNLTKAKEHIRTLISCLIDWVQEGDEYYCHISDAETFLKE